VLSSELLLIAHAVASLFMTGLIWFVQIVHYPLFALVPADAFAQYESRHQKLTTYVVAPVMLAEIGLAAAIAAGLAPGVPRLWGWAGLALCIAVWGATFLISVPLHNKLESGKNDAVIRRLVATNWIRTVLWSARGILSVLMVQAGASA
jgi:hypothetical protein